MPHFEEKVWKHPRQIITGLKGSRIEVLGSRMISSQF